MSMDVDGADKDQDQTMEKKENENTCIQSQSCEDQDIQKQNTDDTNELQNGNLVIELSNSLTEANCDGLVFVDRILNENVKVAEEESQQSQVVYANLFSGCTYETSNLDLGHCQNDEPDQDRDRAPTDTVFELECDPKDDDNANFDDENNVDVENQNDDENNKKSAYNYQSINDVSNLTMLSSLSSSQIKTIVQESVFASLKSLDLTLGVGKSPVINLVVNVGCTNNSYSNSNDDTAGRNLITSRNIQNPTKKDLTPSQTCSSRFQNGLLSEPNPTKGGPKPNGNLMSSKKSKCKSNSLSLSFPNKMSATDTATSSTAAVGVSVGVSSVSKSELLFSTVANTPYSNGKSTTLSEKENQIIGTSRSVVDSDSNENSRQILLASGSPNSNDDPFLEYLKSHHSYGADHTNPSDSGLNPSGPSLDLDCLDEGKGESDLCRSKRRGNNQVKIKQYSDCAKKFKSVKNIPMRIIRQQFDFSKNGAFVCKIRNCFSVVKHSQSLRRHWSTHVSKQEEDNVDLYQYQNSRNEFDTVLHDGFHPGDDDSDSCDSDSANNDQGNQDQTNHSSLTSVITPDISMPKPVSPVTPVTEVTPDPVSDFSDSDRQSITHTEKPSKVNGKLKKVYQCSICNITITRKDNYKRHVMTHNRRRHQTGERKNNNKDKLTNYGYDISSESEGEGSSDFSDFSFGSGSEPSESDSETEMSNVVHKQGVKRKKGKGKSLSQKKLILDEDDLE